MKLYELVGRDKSQGFSPYVWRTKMALAHKGLEAETIPLRFTEIKPTFGFSGSKTVPVLVDGEKVISDSWDIACYLDEAYPDRPKLFKDNVAFEEAAQMNKKVVMPILVPLFKALVAEIHDILDQEDQVYFRASREPRIGCTLEDTIEAREDYLDALEKNLSPYNEQVKDQMFFAGDEPAYTDYIMYGIFQWARATSNTQILQASDPLYKWRSRMDGLYDGFGLTLASRE